MESLYHQITFDEYLAAKQEIKEELLNMAGSFIRIGYRLKQIKQSEAYKNDGYHTLTEFARAEYGLSESATSRFIAINIKFSVGGDSPELLPEFQNFGSGKLSEMLTLSEEDCRLVKETTTVATIREMKRFDKENSNEENYEETVKADVVTKIGESEEKEIKETPENETEALKPSLATSQEWTGIKQVIVEFFRDKKELLNDIYELGNCEDIAERINPSGNLIFKKGLHMLFFYSYSEGVALKTFKQPNKTYTWQEFVELMAEVFGTTYTAPGKIWENFYGEEKIQEEAEQSKETETERTQEETGQSRSELTKTKAMETCDVARNNDDSPRENKENSDFQKEKEEWEKTSENAASSKQIKENEEQTEDSEKIKGQAEITDYFDRKGDYQIPGEVAQKEDNPKLFIRTLAGKVRLCSDDMELEQGDCIMDILREIDMQISTMIAKGYNAEITFSKED